MKQFLGILLLINLGAVGVFSQKPLPPPRALIYTAPAKTELKEFVAADKSFKATFPGTPKAETQDLDVATATFYRVYRQGSNSIVGVYQFQNDLEVARENAFKAYKDTIAKSPKVKIEDERDVDVDGIAAKEFDITEDLQFHKIRILISGNRLYELKSDVTNWQLLSKDNKDKAAEFVTEANRFFASFKLLATEKKPEAVPLDFLGVFNENSYTNTFFGFSLEFPEDWYNYDPSEIEERKNEGVKIFKTDKEKVNRTLAESAKKEVIILVVSQKKYGEAGAANLMFSVLKLPDNRLTSENLVVSTKNLLLNSPIIQLSEDIKTIDMNGTKFSTIRFETTIGNQKIWQRLFVTVKKGYSVNFTMSYLDENGQKALENILKTLKFNKE